MTWSDEATEIMEELLHEIPAPVREATPSDLRQRLKHTLTYHGIDPEEYAAAFSA